MLIETTLRFDRRGNVGIQGANSEVFRAHDPQLGDEVVVKCVQKQGLDASKYFDEAGRLYAVRHPHVVEVLYASQNDEAIFLAMPPYAHSLEAVLQQRALTVREIVRVGTEFLAGLHHVHLRGLVHFDVKPSNILLKHTGTAALTDFGLSQTVDPQGLATPAQVYQTHMAPEYLGTASQLTLAADVYQAGLTLYRMCVGSSQWNAQLDYFVHRLGDQWQSAIVAGNFPSRDAFPAHIPSRLRNAIRASLSVDPAARFTTVLDLQNELAQVDEHLDWQPVFKPEEFYWTVDNGEHEWIVRLVPVTGAAGLFDVHTTRRSLESGTLITLHPYTKGRLSSSDARKLVGKALSKYDT